MMIGVEVTFFLM